ncbi:MAG TPA: acyl-CoA thioesterase [Nannocystaceae bacterium]|nr:acyl-CoA thioesterase [Nannocystaceae bacterium]
MSGVHALPVAIGWGHCDPAGIVYFPRFFELFHQAMETWFGERLGLPYDQVIVQRKIGFPSVHTEADFTKPTRFGETVSVELRLAAIGRSSLTLDYRVVGPGGDGDLRATGRTVVALMDLDPASAGFRRKLPIPDDLRAQLEAFGVCAS